VGIGTTTPAASAALEISSTTKGLLLPRLSTTQMNNIAGALPGLLVFNTTESKFYGCTAAANAAAAVQQNNHDTGYNSTGPIGQSFTVPQNGLLTSITAYSSTSGSRTYTLRVYAGQGFSGTLLGTSAPQTVAGLFTPVTFSLAALNIQLVAGQDYTFSLTVSAGTVNMLYQSGNSYGGGQLYYTTTTDAASDLRFQLAYTAPAMWVPLH
jgi:hypothetical protein